jgi:hypothetical protein
MLHFYTLVELRYVYYDLSELFILFLRTTRESQYSFPEMTRIEDSIKILVFYTLLEYMILIW